MEQLRASEVHRRLKALAAHPPIPGLVISFTDFASSQLDGVLKVTWRGSRQKYVFECTLSSTPLAVKQASAFLKVRGNTTPGARRLVIAPYLSEARLNELAELDVSGMDLSGNCALFADGFSVWRSGSPNLYPESRPIKNIFRGQSSIFVRCFVLQHSFSSMVALQRFATERLGLLDDQEGGSLALSTASKVVHALEELLLISRDKKKLKVIDHDGLMSALAAAHRPSNGRLLIGKGHVSALFKPTSGVRSVITGLASASHYGVLSAPDKKSVYVDDLSRAAALIELNETNVFPTVELIEETSDLVYFDRRSKGGRAWASPVQTWLELSSGGPRDRDAASILQQTLRQPRMAAV